MYPDISDLPSQDRQHPTLVRPIVCRRLVGTGKSSEAAQLFSTSKAERKLIRQIRKGEAVTALTVIYITLAPSEIRTKASGRWLVTSG